MHDNDLLGSWGIRTMIFPEMVKTVRQGAFRGVKSLKSVVLNEGLEVLGTDDSDEEGDSGVF